MKEVRVQELPLLNLLSDYFLVLLQFLRLKKYKIMSSHNLHVISIYKCLTFVLRKGVYFKQCLPSIYSAINCSCISVFFINTF